ncbi:MAG: hypothetical protein M3Q60_21070, partial [Actinomycetota bacterium]|nr:hypothetical protein [Actinomycetota bacterium]
MLFREKNAPRFSLGVAAVRNEKAFGRLRLRATPKTTVAASSAQTFGTRMVLRPNCPRRLPPRASAAPRQREERDQQHDDP